MYNFIIKILHTFYNVWINWGLATTLKRKTFLIDDVLTALFTYIPWNLSIGSKFIVSKIILVFFLVSLLNYATIPLSRSSSKVVTLQKSIFVIKLCKYNHDPVVDIYLPFCPFPINIQSTYTFKPLVTYFLYHVFFFCFRNSHVMESYNV